MTVLDDLTITGEMFPHLPETDDLRDEDLEDGEEEVHQRRTFEVVLRVNFDLYVEDSHWPPEEWTDRLRLGGIAARSVDVVRSPRRLTRGEATEPRQ